MNNWSFLQSGSIGIDRKDIEKVFTGRTVLSSIYQDQRTKQNVMSLLTPVYVAGQLKGIVLLDINKTICGISFILMTALSSGVSQCHANRYRFGARHYHQPERR